MSRTGHISGVGWTASVDGALPDPGATGACRASRPASSRFLPTAGLALLTALLAASSLSGQELRGTVVEAGTGRAIEGAFVSLLDPAGVTATSTLTAADGAYVLRTAIPGEFTIRVERIGYESWSSEALRLTRGGTVTRRLEIPIRAVRLDDLAVTVESHCRPRPGAGPEMARVWEEARKALELNRWTEEESRIRFALRRWVRDVHPETGRVLREQTSSVERRAWRTFVSAPAAELAAEGWVRRLDDGGWRYFAPDADVLLSDTFADGHCFALVRGEGDEAGLVGLAFEPLDRSRPDVAGVLWLDPTSAGLRHLDYRYTDLDLGIGRHDGGGRVEFARLPTGHVFVRSWVIRMPMPAERTGVAMRSGPGGLPFEPRRELVLARYRHAGGEAVRAQVPGGEAVELAEWGSVAGTVADERGAPLRGVDVELIGTPYRARTDGEGEFRIASVPPGTYTLLAQDPEAAILAVPGADATVIVVRAGETRVDVALPSGDATIAARCAEAAPVTRPRPGHGAVAFFGVVRKGATGRPAPGARVFVATRAWALEVHGPGVAIDEAWNGISVETDPDGVFLACGLPGGQWVVAQAATDGAASDTASARTPRDGRFRLDLELVDGRRPLARFDAAGEEPDLQAVVEEILAAVPEEEDTGLATLVGTVRSAETGQPVAGARVRLIGRDEERITSEHGTFAIADLPRGRYRVVTERLGLASDTAEVDLRRGAGTMASLLLETRPVTLPTLEVEIQRTFRNRRLAGYYDRMNRGLGDFVTREDLEVRDVISNFRRIPSVRIQQCVNSSGLRTANCWDLKIARGYGLDPAAPCPPHLYIDGFLYSNVQGIEAPGGNPFTILQSLPRDMLEGIEVYRSPAAAPAQYRMLGDACGIVLVWTRGR